MRGRWTRRVALLALVIAAGCGRKGPPLEPFVRIPDAVETITARRVGDEVFLTLTVPAENVDASTPVALDRIEVWGYTGTAPPDDADWPALATPVVTVPVVVPAPDALPAPRPAAGAAPSGPARPAEVIVVRETLAPEHLVQGPLPEADGQDAAAPVGVDAEPPPLRRFYAAFPFDPRGRPGPPGGVAELALEPPPPAPGTVRAVYTETALSLAWAPSGGLLGFLLEGGLAAEPVPAGVRVAPASGVPAPPPTRYNLYAAGPAPAVAPDDADAWRARLPAPLNMTPIDAPAFTEPVRFGVERCFVVRAARGAGAGAVEGPASPRLCVTPEDVFPPAPPTGLAAVPGAGRVDLIWEPGAEADLAGYLVLRGEVGAGTLAPITAEPVLTARFLDDNVTSGVRYEYAVVAVDGRVPVPNQSLPSARVEATAR